MLVQSLLVPMTKTRSVICQMMLIYDDISKEEGFGLTEKTTQNMSFDLQHVLIT